MIGLANYSENMSCPARGMGVEIGDLRRHDGGHRVMPREGHGSRNSEFRSNKAVQCSHAPRGAWEQKLPCLIFLSTASLSCPARGMGVEINIGNLSIRERKTSCPARGMGVEIYLQILVNNSTACHAPRGAWEQKFDLFRFYARYERSCPARGMGVEICLYSS